MTIAGGASAARIFGTLMPAASGVSVAVNMPVKVAVDEVCCVFVGFAVWLINGQSAEEL